jgi:hypothetical protein
MTFTGLARARSGFGRVAFPAVPWLTWGPVAGTTAGEVLQVAYSVSRPGVDTARLVLADGRELVMTVSADRLEVLLPPDAADGWAKVIAELVDEWGHTGTAELDVLIVGLPSGPPVPRPEPAGGLPRPQRLVRAPARVTIASGPTGLRRREPQRTVVARVGRGEREWRSAPIYRGRSAPGTVRIAAGAGHVRSVRRADVAAITVPAGATSVTHRDGREIEEALLLDLL